MEIKHWDFSKTPILQEIKQIQDADFAGNQIDSKSTSGDVLWNFGWQTFVQISRACERQTAVSLGSTGAEIISIDAGLRMQGIPAMNLWYTIIEKNN